MQTETGHDSGLQHISAVTTHWQYSNPTTDFTAASTGLAAGTAATTTTIRHGPRRSLQEGQLLPLLVLLLQLLVVLAFFINTRNLIFLIQLKSQSSESVFDSLTWWRFDLELEIGSSKFSKPTSNKFEGPGLESGEVTICGKKHIAPKKHKVKFLQQQVQDS